MTTNSSKRVKTTNFNQLLSNYVVYCDVKLGESDRSFAIKIMLRSIGAKVAAKIDKNVTHLIFRNGSQNSLELAKKYNTVEEEYKQIIREEVAQFNELNRHNKSNTPSFLTNLTTNSKSDGLQIDFDSSALQKSIYYELEKSKSVSSISSSDNENSHKENQNNNGDSNYLFVNNVRKSVDSSNRETPTDSDHTEDVVVTRPPLNSVNSSGGVNQGQVRTTIASKADAACNISTTDSTDTNESVVKNRTLKSGLSTTAKKRRKLFTPGRQNLTSLSGADSPNVTENKSLGGKKNYVPPYVAKLIDQRYTFTSIKKSNRGKPTMRSNRTETPANRLVKCRRPLKEIVGNISRNSGRSNNSSIGIMKPQQQKAKIAEENAKPSIQSASKRKRVPEKIIVNECSSSDFQSPIAFDKTSAKSQPRPKPEFLVVTNLTKQQSATVLNAVKLLGRFKYETNVTDRTTHVISSGQRTKNFLVALINGCWILSFEWIEASLHAKKWLAEEEFEMTAINEWVKKRRIERQIYGEPHKIDLFRKYLIYLGNFSTESTIEDFHLLIKKCGGNIVHSPFDANIIIGSCAIQVKDAQYVTKTWIVDSIMDNKIIPIRKKYLQKTT